MGWHHESKEIKNNKFALITHNKKRKNYSNFLEGIQIQKHLGNIEYFLVNEEIDIVESPVFNMHNNNKPLFTLT